MSYQVYYIRLFDKLPPNISFRNLGFRMIPIAI
jgi:hypothetical protein